MFVITGGGSGIGKALALALADRHESVLIIGRRQEALLATKSHSPLIESLVADVSTPAGRAHLVSYLAQKKIKGFVHNAALIEPIAPLSDIAQASWHQVMATNLEAPMFLTQQLFDELHDARVLHIGSGVAYFPISGWSLYCISKAALAMLTRCWQLEYPQRAFASVMPGIIDTSMQAIIRHSEHMAPESQAFFRELKQTQRLISPNTVAMFLAWLLLDVETSRFVEKEWDIYDTTHHSEWLCSPHVVPPLER